MQGLDDVFWLDHNVNPMHVDDMPHLRVAAIRDVLTARDQARQDASDQAEAEADQQRLQAEHEQRMAAQGLTPGGLPMRG